MSLTVNDVKQVIRKRVENNIKPRGKFFNYVVEIYSSFLISYAKAGVAPINNITQFLYSAWFGASAASKKGSYDSARAKSTIRESLKIEISDISSSRSGKFAKFGITLTISIRNRILERLEEGEVSFQHGGWTDKKILAMFKKILYKDAVFRKGLKGKARQIKNFQQMAEAIQSKNRNEFLKNVRKGTPRPYFKITIDTLQSSMASADIVKKYLLAN